MGDSARQLTPAVPIAGEVLETKSVTVGDNVFVPIFLQEKPGAASKVRRFSQREIRWLDKLLQTRSLELAGIEIGITVDEGKKWLRKKHFREYMHQKARQAALAAGTDVENHIAWLRDVRDERVTPSDTALEASKQLSRFLKPAAPQVLNVQQTNIHAGAAAPSPYKNMSRDELAGEMRKRLQVLDALRGGAR